LKVRAPGGERYTHIKETLRPKYDLHTVCEEAHCPNVGECWGEGTATVMILGDTCTRGCRFCAVTTGNPRGAYDPREPEHTARTIAAMGLDYVVITMVDRDDILDGGAAHVARDAGRPSSAHARHPRRGPRRRFPGEPPRRRDGRRDGAPDVFAHNIETVDAPPALGARRAVQLERSLAVLAHAKKVAPARYTKSSIMVGLGETLDEVLEAMRALRDVGVDVLTLGQYLRPSPKHLAVERYVPPEEFDGARRGARDGLPLRRLGAAGAVELQGRGGVPAGRPRVEATDGGFETRRRLLPVVP
jgi:lipoic acid synthetase